MTYKEWNEDFTQKRDTIIAKLQKMRFSHKEIVDYFVFENMVKKEPDFCLLYAQNKKCHDTSYLNCMMCACPFFRFDDDGLAKEGDLLIKSECTINSKNAKRFVYEGVVHLDCSDCKVPHTKQFVMKNSKLIIKNMI